MSTELKFSDYLTIDQLVRELNTTHGVVVYQIGKLGIPRNKVGHTNFIHRDYVQQLRESISKGDQPSS
jgi:phosphoribosylaminoimidazole carboxylase (NCAIR synthetase)